MANGEFLEAVKGFLPKSWSVILSGAFFIGTMLVGFASNKTHIADVQSQQEKRLTALEDAVKNDLATRREVDDVKATVNRIEDKLDQELQYHRSHR